MRLSTKLAIKKYQNKIIGAVVVALVIWAVVVAARPAPFREVGVSGTNRADTGALTVTESAFDFGTISMAKGKVSRIIKIKNSGSEPVTVNKLYTSCMCTTAALMKDGQTYGPFGMPMHGPIPTIGVIIAPNNSAEVEIAFDPAAHGPAGVGRVNRAVTLETNAGTQEIRFSATVTP